MIEGHCHCEAVRWTYSLPVEGVTACNCTLCSRYGALWAYGFLNKGITISGSTKAYERGRKLSGFHFCSNCGCLTHYLLKTKDDQNQLKIAVNLRMAADPKTVASFPIDHFDGRDKFEDLPRDGRCVADLWF